ncbi:MAG: DNA repair protein RecN [Ruminiclostridium sp.]
MLKELYIENLAVIEKADIDFGEKFNIFSGETGAGKSILIGAINAILGGRVHKDVIRTGTDKAVVTAVFDYIPKKTTEKLIEYGYEAEGELLIRREISADGKGSVKICGKPATAAILKEVAGSLIDIHGQQDNRILVDNTNQRELIDSFGGLTNKISDYGELFREFSKLSKRIKKLEEEAAEKDIRLEELKKAIDEIEKLRLKKGDEAVITEKLNRARNMEEINRALLGTLSAISGDEETSGITDLLSSSVERLNGISEYIPECNGLSKRISDLIIELDDIGTEVSRLLPDSDEEEDLSSLEEKMSGILWLKRKYNKELDEILDSCEDMKEELSALSEADNTISALNEERKKLGDEVKAVAMEISEERKVAAKRLSDEISEQLRFLDMPDVRLEFLITRGKITVNGMDSVEMMISVNKGEDLKPISKVASGGELSRIMLAVKSVSAENDDTPTMIFDEIDTGISGMAAKKVGKKLSEIAQKRQVICVTHLAQIAALSDNHLLIKKNTDNERTYTTVHTLNYDEKLHEIARIISGNSDSMASLKNAEELISNKN